MKWEEQALQDDYLDAYRRNRHVWKHNGLERLEDGHTHRWWRAFASLNAGLDPALRLEELRCGDVVWQFEKNGRALSFDRSSDSISVDENHRIEVSVFSEKAQLLRFERTDRNTEQAIAVYDVSEGAPMRTLIRNFAQGRTITKGLADVRKTRRLIFAATLVVVSAIAYTLHAKGWLHIEALDRAAFWLNQFKD